MTPSRRAKEKARSRQATPPPRLRGGDLTARCPPGRCVSCAAVARGRGKEQVSLHVQEKQALPPPPPRMTKSGRSSQGSLRQPATASEAPFPAAALRKCLFGAGPTAALPFPVLFPRPLGLQRKIPLKAKNRVSFKVRAAGSLLAGSSPFRHRFGQPGGGGSARENVPGVLAGAQRGRSPGAMSDEEDSEAVAIAAAFGLLQEAGDFDDRCLIDDLNPADLDDDEEDDDADDRRYEETEADGEIVRLEEQLSINAYDYNCHLDLIKLLRQEKESYGLRRARQNMSELFPLTEELWLDWLKDEILRARKDSEREKIYELFERAVKDYICPGIWLEYAQYSIGGIGQEGGIARVRAILERAVIAVGLHVTKGAAIWETYREFENAMLATMQPAPGSVPTPEQQQNIKAQLEKIHSLYRRQLGIPLIDMESAFLEYENWTEEPIPEAVLQNYAKALKQLQKYKPYEEALLVAEAPKLAEYQAYIDFEMKVGDPARIQLIYERALGENCLVPDLWARYTQYLDRQLKVKELVLSAHERAVRNCPWTVKLWIESLLAMERHHVEHRVISETFEKALNAGFTQATDYVEIWQAYLDYLRRRVDFTQDSSKELEELRSAFARALKYLKQDVEERFSESGDPSCTLMQAWARIEARWCNNMQKARELWDFIMVKGNAKYANMWLEYYNLERAHGDALHCRKALYRAVQCTQDYPEHVCEVLLTLERIEGTLEDWDTAVQRTETRLARVKEQRAKAAEKEAALAKQEEEKAEQRKQAQAKKKALKKSQKPKAGVKRKAGGDGEWEEEEEEEAPLPVKRPKECRRAVLDEQEQEELDELELEMNTELEIELGLFGRKADLKPKEEGAASKWKDAPRILHDSTKEGFTVFVSNLSYNMAEPEAKLRALFASCGEVAEVRPIYSNKGTFRGYSYVEFKDERSALQAFELDRTVVEGRPMFVSPYVDKSKNPDFKVFKYSTALEKHKLFISGLPFSCTKEELQKICEAHGKVKDIRMVTNRAGKPKGLAYVEFENEAQASQALLKMDGLTMKDHIIKVAISNPPSRRFPEKPESQSQDQSLRQASGARRKGRTQLAMVPRALQRHNNPASKTENGTVQNPPATPSPPVERPKMTNADFAKLLLNK
ncbi:squamous cell carcinoma antigen recognized by T-cells 3 isoform X2 [Ahaetulla prasina]|uniref:squamous cell carcinoma antigen recognized by T-cells 3 isoform X2 n=1 Tax=Ahaetulla prasina TaxID=499056 RepID=UPI002649FB9E|nr:squamous cell carcinoma antigen recognized by T-cells 3 isoform X2 [Ahaetulla prasina]